MRRLLCLIGFHRYGKLTHSEWDKYMRCLTCGKAKFPSEMRSGHYKDNLLEGWR